MKTILHCASSYPDPIAPDTRASSLLLEMTRDDFDHKVYSFRRADWRGALTAIPFDDTGGQGHRAMVYGALPKGLRFARTMAEIARWIIADAEQRNLKPDMVQAHKVSLDGIVGATVAAHFNVPLVLTVQANTDARIIKTRRDLRDQFQTIWHKAALVFPFAPNAQDAMEDLLAPRTGPMRILPCPTTADDIIAPTPRASGASATILTAFHLAHYGNKNVQGLMAAVAEAARQVPDIRLDVVGGGDLGAFLKVSQMAQKIAPGRVQMLGAQPGAQMQARMNKATAFAMLSHRESFGMVYSEALLAGTPCLHSTGRAIDGLFPEGNITLSVDPSDTSAMAQALVRLVKEEDAFKARIATAQGDGQLEILRRPHITKNYADGLRQSLEAAPFQF